VAVRQLVSANALANPNLLRVGQQLAIPRDSFEPAQPPAFATLARGAMGTSVQRLQQRLLRSGFLSQGAFATGPGVYGPRTEAAVRAFQASRGLPQSGQADARTQAALSSTDVLAPARSEASTLTEEVTQPLGEAFVEAAHVPRFDGSRPAASVRNVRAWEAVEAEVRSTPDDRSAGLYDDVLNQFAVGVNLRYARRDGNTYCNIFAWDATRAMGAEIPHWVNGRELDANSCHRWLATTGARNGWSPAAAAQAQAAANAGRPTVATWNNPGGIGHIAMVRPGTLTAAGPAIAQAGAKNFNKGHLADGFGARVPTYWVHA
jgi:Putative peptidoglycan binding domain